MIYQFTIRTGYPHRNIFLFAHPSWPFTVNEKGDRSELFEVRFGNEPEVYRKVLDPVPTLEKLGGLDTTDTESGWVVTNIEEVHDLRALG
jgi:hypothetical protein